jgi:hypothetical protein
MGSFSLGTLPKTSDEAQTWTIASFAKISLTADNKF